MPLNNFRTKLIPFKLPETVEHAFSTLRAGGEKKDDAEPAELDCLMLAICFVPPA